jgi:diguanylate cyclase (GGDEF)-like protein/PAS domain S-box-containing protein
MTIERALIVDIDLIKWKQLPAKDDHSLDDKINELKEELLLNRAMLSNSLCGLYVLEGDRFSYVNQSLCEISGYSMDELISGKIGLYDLIAPHERSRIAVNLSKRMNGTEPFMTYQSVICNKSNEEIPVEIYGTTIELNGKILIAGGIFDITYRKELELALVHQTQMYQSLFEYNTDAVISFDLDGVFVQCNPICEQISGYKIEELYNESFLPLIVEEHKAATYENFIKTINGEPQKYYSAITHKKGHRIEFHCTNIPIIVNDEIIGVYAIIKDVTEQKKMEEELNQLAFFDPLTGLPNRTLFEEKVEKSFYEAKENGYEYAVLLLDIDRFKNINDLFGHNVGDKLIAHLAAEIRKSMKEHEIVARIGGDEFAFLLPRITDRNLALQVADKILSKFKKTIEIDHRDLYVSVSIGIAFGSNKDGQTMFREADISMYHAKQQGGNQYVVFTDELDKSTARRMNLEHDMSKGIHNGEFELEYQPILNLASGQIAGFEALVRWNHPEYGRISPIEFISLAEETGHIHALGDWVLKTACLQQLNCEQILGRPLQMAVNVSVAQLYQTNYVTKLNRFLTSIQMDPKKLTLEVTESILLQRETEIIDRLKAIHDLGVKVSLDDFGTGYSSLSYLTHLFIDALKIDKSFVQNIHLDSKDSKIVSTVISLAQNLGLKVIAEGIELKEQLTILQQQNCDEAQGYLFSKPLPVDEIEHILSNNIPLMNEYRYTHKKSGSDVS